jgi:hypothetical protein
MQAYCANSVACHSRGLRLESDSREPLVGTIDGTVKRVGSTALPGARNEYGRQPYPRPHLLRRRSAYKPFDLTYIPVSSLVRPMFALVPIKVASRSRNNVWWIL